MAAGRDDARAARLARALRTNLKRRKAAGGDGGVDRPSPPAAEATPPDPAERD